KSDNSNLKWLVNELGSDCLTVPDKYGDPAVLWAARCQPVDSLQFIFDRIGAEMFSLKYMKGETLVDAVESDPCRTDRSAKRAWISSTQRRLEASRPPAGSSAPTAASAGAKKQLDPSFTDWDFILHKNKKQLMGRGGFGKVYKVVTDRNQTVAVKVLPLSGTGQSGKLQKAVEMEKRGVEILKRLSHPNIVQFLKCEHKSDGLYIFTELVSGHSLLELMQRQNKPFKESGICSGLNFLHCQQRGAILHRDIKSSNVMLTNEGVIKLIDFGLAREIFNTCSLSAGNQPKGTWHFMAPEMLMGEGNSIPYSAKTDVWAFGCTVYELTTMQPPDGNEPQQRIVILRYGERAMPRIADGFSAGLKDFYLRCVDYDPRKRADTAELLRHSFLSASSLQELPTAKARLYVYAIIEQCFEQKCVDVPDVSFGNREGLSLCQGIRIQVGGAVSEAFKSAAGVTLKMERKLRATLEAGDSEELQRLCGEVGSNIELEVGGFDKQDFPFEELRKMPLVHHVACKPVRLSCLELLIDRFGPGCLKFRNGRGETPVHLAAQHQDESWMKLVKEKGGRGCLRIVDRWGKRVAHFAAGNRKSNSCLKWLVKEVGSDCLTVPDKDGNMAVHLAAQHQGIESLEWIKKQIGTDCFRLKTKSDRTAFHIAAQKSDNSNLKWLVKELGSECLTVPDRDGDTAVHFATKHQGIESLEWIKRQIGTDCFRLKSNSGTASFHFAAQKSEGSNLEWLVKELGSDCLTVPDCWCCDTVVHWAAQHQPVDSLQFIFDQIGAKMFSLMNMWGRTPADAVESRRCHTDRSAKRQWISSTQRRLEASQPPAGSSAPTAASAGAAAPRPRPRARDRVEPPPGPTSASELDPNFTDWDFIRQDNKKQLIGRGGFGKVYKALTDRNQTVVSKNYH
uniref:Protein kinase domain-containing protein n=1 Tax=Macrostomum lignano TaxID=282301 RepID=A0A1I8IF83_9PLAT